MTSASVSPFDFRSRTFCDRVDLSNGKSYYVSSVGPNLQVIAVADVEEAQKVPPSQRKPLQPGVIKVFTVSDGPLTALTIKGVSKFSDSDFLIVYSSFLVAVIHSEHLSDCLLSPCSPSICTKFVVEIGDKINSLKALSERRIAICQDNDGVHVLTLTGDSEGVIGRFHRSQAAPNETRITASSFVNTSSDSFRVYTAVDDGKLAVTEHSESRGRRKEKLMALSGPSFDVRKVNKRTIHKLAVVRDTTDNIKYLVVVTENALFVCCVKNPKLTIAFPLFKDCQTDFVSAFYIKGKKEKYNMCLALLGRGSVYVLDPTSPCPMMAPWLRGDILMSGQLTHLYYDNHKSIERRLVYSGNDSSWLTNPVVDDLHQPNNEFSIACCLLYFGSTVYSIDLAHNLSKWSYTNGKRSKITHMGKLIIDQIEPIGVNAPPIQPSMSSSKVHRIVINTPERKEIIDLGTNPPTVVFDTNALKKIGFVWGIAIGTDFLTLLPNGFLVLLDDKLRIRCVAKFPDSMALRQPLLLSLSIVRRTKIGNKCGILFAFQFKIYHFVYTVSSSYEWDQLEQVCRTKTSPIIEQTPYPIPAYGHGGNTSVAAHLDLSRIVDMIVRVGGRTTLLMDNGSIVEYIVTLNDTHLSFSFLSARRVDCLGFNLVDSPLGTLVIGLINDYQKTQGEFRKSQDNYLAITNAYANAGLCEFSSFIPALINPWTGDVLSQISCWSLPTTHMNAFYVDTEAWIMHHVNIRKDTILGYLPLQEMLRPVQFPIHLSHRRPPGEFTGIASAVIDTRFLLVACGYLNIHIYIFDTVTGCMNESSVIGWELGMGMPTLTTVVNGKAFLTTRVAFNFECIEVRLEPCNDNGYSTTLSPIVRSPLNSKLIKMIEPKFDSEDPDYVVRNIKSVRMRGRPYDVPLLGKMFGDSKNWCINVVEFVHTKARGTLQQTYIMIAPVHADDGSSSIALMCTAIDMPYNQTRQFIGLNDRSTLLTVDVTGNLLTICREGEAVWAIPVPVRFLTPPQYIASGNLLFFASVDPCLVVKLFGVTVLPCETITKSWYIDMPFEREYCQKLFVRISPDARKGIHCVYIYRLMLDSNWLQVVRCDWIMADPKQSVTHILPSIHMEMDPVKDLEKIDVHFLKSEFLFLNDGPRLIRICECCRKYYDDSPITEEMKRKDHKK